MSKVSFRAAPPPHPQACHKLVASVAQAAAGEFYESIMGASNALWKEWKRQHPDLGPKALEKEFIRQNWRFCIDFARATLAHMLQVSNLPDHAKDDIYDALLADSTLQVGRYNPAQARALMYAEMRANMEGWE